MVRGAGQDAGAAGRARCRACATGSGRDDRGGNHRSAPSTEAEGAPDASPDAAPEAKRPPTARTPSRTRLRKRPRSWSSSCVRRSATRAAQLLDVHDAEGTSFGDRVREFISRARPDQPDRADRTSRTPTDEPGGPSRDGRQRPTPADDRAAERRTSRASNFRSSITLRTCTPGSRWTSASRFPQRMRPLPFPSDARRGETDLVGTRMLEFDLLQGRRRQYRQRHPAYDSADPVQLPGQVPLPGRMAMRVHPNPHLVASRNEVAASPTGRRRSRRRGRRQRARTSPRPAR